MKLFPKRNNVVVEFSEGRPANDSFDQGEEVAIPTKSVFVVKKTFVPFFVHPVVEVGDICDCQERVREPLVERI